MLALLVALILLALLFVVLGAAVHGLLWLFIILAVVVAIAAVAVGTRR